LFHSLPLPNDLKRMLSDIYTGNIMDFVVGNESLSGCIFFLIFR
jgi:hypothetical protein